MPLTSRFEDDGEPKTPGELALRFAPSESAGESLASLTALLDLVPAMIAYWDTELRNHFANQAYMDWFGVEPVDIVGNHIRDLLGPTVFELNLPYIEGALAGEKQLFERVLTDPLGHIRYSQASYTPHIVDGQVRGFFALVTDVSELKGAQAELSARNDQLAALIKSRELLMATLTHDLRAPLGAIIGYAELLTDAISELSNDDLVSYQAVISRNANELLLMVNQLVEYEKNELGDAEFTIEPIDARAALMATVVSLKLFAKTKGIALVVEDSSDTCTILTDAQALNRVLTNLTTNAIKFADSGSVTLRAMIANGRGQIEVTDTGPGISPEDQQVIFNAFERGSSTALRKSDGIGLGLHICLQLTNLTGGDIAVISDLGQGSTFTVSWPLAP